MTPAEAHDPRDYVRLLARRGWILLACVLLIPVGAYVLTASRPKIFEASTLLQVAGGVDTTGLGPDFAAPASNLAAIAQFVNTTAVAEEAARQLGEPAGSVLGGARAGANEDTGFLTISATAPTPKRAAAVANAYAAALNATRQKRAIQRVNEAIATTQDTLKQTPKTDIGTRTQLREQLQKLGTLKQAQSQNVTVLQPATSGKQIAPHPRRNATIAILLGLLIGVALMLVAERVDRRVRRPEDLEKVSGLPFLATIPHEAFPGGDDHDPEVPEAFQTLRNTLTYFNADFPLRSLIVTSGLKGEGKTTVAANLAVAYAAFGKRVIIVDTDLRKPDMAGRLGFLDTIGLSDVLVGNASLADALKEVPPYGPGLRLLPAGPIPPNPSALLGSLRMASLLDELSADADLVILDTTPLLLVSDAFPLLEKVSGVLALARLDKTPRDAIRKMAQIMESAGARTLGIVATDAKRSRIVGYGYGYGYGQGYGARYGEERQGENIARQQPEAASSSAASGPGAAHQPPNDPNRAFQET